jgi:antitoxin ParD1/3/4
MTIKLTPKLERLVRKKVKGGGYTSASEVVREALRFFEGKEDLVAFRRDDLRGKITEGLASLRRGEAVDGEVFFARLETKLKTLQKRKAA